MSKTDEIKTLYKDYLMPTYAPALALVKGKGTRVWDAEGKVYLDLAAGISVVNLGHSHPRVVHAIQKQVEQLTHVSNLYYTENQGRLAEKLSRLMPGSKCFFANSGAEANEGMLKLARLWGHDQGRYEVICMKNSFHGRTLTTAAATGQDKVKKGFDPLPDGFVHAEFNNLDSVRELIGDKTVAIMLEAIQGEGGVIPADPAFIQGVRKLCHEKNLLMLCDEVQCGMGRTGTWFGFQQYDVEPDVFTLAKALGNGFPIGAVVAAAQVADTFQPGHHASTFGGTPLACAAALATLESIQDDGLLDQAVSKGKMLASGLKNLVEKYEHVSTVRGCGLMLGLVLDQDAKPVVDMMAAEGVLALTTAGNVIRLLPPLTIKDSEIEEALEIMDDCLAEWHGINDTNGGEDTETGENA